MSATTGRIFQLALFAMAMAYVEAMVVVYLRALLPEPESWTVLPAGVAGLLREHGVYFKEQTREAATIVMLLMVSALAARGWRARAGAFLLIFGVWDIFYYVFLRLWLGWPRSLMDTDVLFLIPGPWVGPVLLPVVISVAMVVAGIYLLKAGGDGHAR